MADEREATKEVEVRCVMRYMKLYSCTLIHTKDMCFNNLKSLVVEICYRNS